MYVVSSLQVQRNLVLKTFKERVFLSWKYVTLFALKLKFFNLSVMRRKINFNFLYTNNLRSRFLNDFLRLLKRLKSDQQSLASVVLS